MKKKRVITLDDLVQSAMRVAEKHLEQGEQLCPTLIACGDDGGEESVVIGYPDYGNPDVKALARGHMRHMIAERGCTKYIFVMEAWIGVKTKMPPKGYLPQNDPERVDALCITAVEKGGEHYCLVIEFKRLADKKSITFEKPYKLEHMLEGNLATLFDTSTETRQ